MAEEHIRNDFTQHYSDTYIRVGTKESFKVDYVLDVGECEDGRDIDFKVQLHDLGKISYRDLKIVPGFPSPKLVNTEGGEAVFVSRTSERQFKRGLCNSTIHATSISVDDFSEVIVAASLHQKIRHKSGGAFKSLGRVYVPSSIAKEFCLPKYPSYEECLHSLNKGRNLSRAFCEKFAVSISPIGDLPILWLETVPVGEIKQANVELFDHFLRQEVSDFLNRYCPNIPFKLSVRN